MKRTLNNILIAIIIIATTGVGFLVPQKAEAFCIPGLNLATVTESFNINDCVAMVGTGIVLPVAGKVLQIAGFIFGKSVDLNLNISALARDIPNNPSPISVIWRTIRDLSSIVFIFVLIWTSIQTILGIGGADIKKTVGLVIVAGLLMNFSLFFAKVAVDASNVVSLAFYHAIAGNPPPKPTTFAEKFESATSVDDGGISNVFQSIFETQTLLNVVNEQNSKLMGLKGIPLTIMITFGGAAVMFVASVSFLAAALMFIYRFIILVLFMGLSPLMVIGIIIPSLKSAIKPYYEMFINQLIVAPIYLGFMYIALLFLTNDNLISMVGKNNVAGTGLAGSLGGWTIGPIFYYVLVIIIMYVGLSVSSKTGGKGASWAMEFIKKGGRQVSQFAYNRTVAFGAEKAGNAIKSMQSIDLTKKYDSSSLGKSDFGKKLGKTVGFVGNKIIKPAAMLASGGILTEGNVREVQRSVQSGLKSTLDYKLAGMKNREEEAKANKDYDSGTKTLVAEKEAYEKALQDTKEIAKMLAVIKNPPSGANINDLVKNLNKSLDNLSDSMSKLSSKQSEKLVTTVAKSDDENAKFVTALASGKTIEAIMKSEISDNDKSKIMKLRAEGIIDLIKAGRPKSSDIENYMKEDFNSEQKKKIGKARESWLIENLQKTVSGALSVGDLKERIKKLDGKELGKIFKGLDSTTRSSITDDQLKRMADSLFGSQLKDMVESLDDNTARTIGSYIHSLGQNGHRAYSYIDENKSAWKV